MSAKETLPGAPRPEPPRYGAAVPVARMARTEAIPFDLAPAADEREEIGRFLGVRALRSLRLKGRLTPEDADGWRAEGRLTASVVQDCVVTLAPVARRVDETVLRAYVPSDRLVEANGIDIDADEEDEPSGFDREIDLADLMIETLALALDPYPRADGAEMARSLFAPPGAAPLDDDALKPFAGLEALRDKLAGGKG